MLYRLTCVFVLCLWAFTNGDRGISVVDPSTTSAGRYPTGDPRLCLKENKKLIQFEVLPGLGWDNLQNEDASNIVVYNYSLCRTTLDGRFLIPDDVETVPRKSSKVNSFAELISHFTEYTSVTAHSVNVHAGFSGFGVSIGGSFSDSYQHMKSQQIGSKSVTTRVQLRYVRYTARLKSKIQLHPDFKARLLDIVDSLRFNRSGEARYKSQLLVRDFGTHFVRVVDAGAVLVQEDQVSSDYVNSKDSTKTEITAGASASFFSLFSFGVSYTTSSSETEVKKYMKQRSSSQVAAYGGPKFKAKNFTANDWADGVDENMVAIDRHGDPLQFLITSSNLPELEANQVYRLKRSVEDAVVLYYKYNTYRGCTTIDSPNFSPAANVDDGTCESAPNSTTFGGVYQTCLVDPRSTNGDICSAYNMNQKNPKTGGFSCPNGYQTVKIHSATLSTVKPNPSCVFCGGGYYCCLDEQYKMYRMSMATYSLYWCAASRASPNSGYLFGGLYTSTVKNPLTQETSCPLNFYPQQLGTGLKICISDDFELGNKYAVSFGGFISCESGNPLAMDRPNPGDKTKSNLHSLQYFLQSSGTWPKRCPAGHSQHLAYVDEGCEISYCLKSGSLSSRGLPKVRRPPFMNPPEAVSYVALDPATQKWVKVDPVVQHWVKIVHSNGTCKNKPVPSSLSSSTTSLSTAGIVGIAIGALLAGCLLTVVLIVIMNVKRRSARYRSERLMSTQNDYGTRS